MSQVRITGGKWRSRRVAVADASGLRPTPDRVRETLFNWLGQDLSGLACLDLFSGSGILGFEAASRGAGPVAMVERSRPVFAQLKKNAAALHADGIELHCGDALNFAASSPGRFDLVFLDPPYGQGWLDRVAPLLPALAAPGARIYAESESPIEVLGDWRVTRHGRAGQVCFHVLEKE